MPGGRDVRHIHAILSVFVWESSTYLINHPLDEIELPNLFLITEALPGLGQLPTPSGRFGGKTPRMGVDSESCTDPVSQLRLEICCYRIGIQNTTSQYEKTCILLEGSFIEAFLRSSDLQAAMQACLACFRRHPDAPFAQFIAGQCHFGLQS